jgi:hypothetical protein
VCVERRHTMPNPAWNGARASHHNTCGELNEPSTKTRLDPCIYMSLNRVNRYAKTYLNIHDMYYN